MLFDDLAADLVALEARGLRRHRRVLESPQSARVVVNGRDYVAFCSNDYLGLAADPRLIAAACAGARTDGVGAGASHLILGHASSHHRLEAALARFVQLPRALVFSTGYMANLGTVTALVGRHDDIFADKLNHASLNDAAQLSRANFKRYAHADLGALERLLAASGARRKLVVTDAVFSMDGDIAPVPKLLKLCERFDAWLLLDDAHGFGVLGEAGGGVLRHFNLASPRIIYMATLGKAAGVSGAFVAGEPDMIETLIQGARTYIAREHGRRETLARLIEQLKTGVAGLRWQLMPATTAIQPLVIGGNVEVMRVSAALADCGVLVPAIRPPTVPTGTARLRISLSAAHTNEDVARLIDALRRVEKVS